MRTILISIFGLFFVACSSPKAPLPTVSHIEIEKYLGTWYEIARYEHSFEVGCRDVSANYSLKENGEIAVLNSCTKEGEVSQAKGSAYATNVEKTKLKVTFFWPFYGDYWILMRDDAYEYAVIGEPSRKYFWILSRTKKLDENIKKTILLKMPELGYDENKLIWTKQK